MMTRDEILKTLEENRDTIRGFGVRELGLLGSYARGDQTEGSDMDFLVQFERSTFDNYFGLKSFLEQLFDCKVDLAFKDTIKLRIRTAVLEEAVYIERF